METSSTSSTTLVRFHDDVNLRTNLNADQFCGRCSAFLSQNADNGSTYSTPWPHSELGNLKGTGRYGCHLCSIIVRCIGDTYGDEDAHVPVLLFVKYKILRVQVGPNASRYTPLLRLETCDGISLQSIVCFRKSLDTVNAKQRIIDTISGWMRSCRYDHEHCSDQLKGKLPTRLLYSSGNLVQLITSEGALPSDIRYMTLSHRWPKNPGLKLKKNTLVEFQNGLSRSSLPPLFRDFCELSTAVGCPYVWIDALCIVQDDDQDWVKESALMVDVYTNSRLNVVAGSSQQHQSLYVDRNSLMSTPCIITGSDMAKTLGVDAVFTFTSDETGQIAKLATDQRAWILQECQISPRMVYLGDTEIIWECVTKLLSESSQKGGINWTQSDIANRPRNIRAQIARHREDAIGLTEARCDSIWTGLISKYTSLDVSFENDRLVAISGLSQYLQQQESDKFGSYFAGLWEIGFERQLLWRPYLDRGVTSSVSYLAPSWSWASHTSRIAYYGSPAGAQSVSRFVERLIVSTTPKSASASHGRLSDGNFTCLANICPIHLSYEQVESFHTYIWSIQAFSSTSRTPVDISITLDRPDQILGSTTSHNSFRDFYIMPLLCYDIEDHGERYSTKPRHQKLFTDWQCQEGRLFPASLPKGRWRLPSESEDHYALAALILFPVVERKGHWTRAGIAEFGNPDTITLLQKACRISNLALDMYLSVASDRHGYEIVVQ